ncbi:LacI family DNA-binding transcriptional regulator [Limnochorda pilosa]|uniref:LacI family transcriptional regulator n=1 Tax=Limnochorda pilosa TaxID=1555112 RepID=A0A0K2SIP9_LIMPI|nr:LacI family DNA-binding transcriptional regulator [Limnochorda pilosa]BAS27006.1 LacI family transcriptional regulator [Limnochorda pilosa]
MPVTIKDVARSAGVSPSTVSRVISDHPRISQGTKERVRRAMKELGYHPNAIARSLVTQSSRTLGLVMSRAAEAALANPFFPEVIRGIGSVANQARYALLLSTSLTPRQELEECQEMLESHRVDGLVLLASRVEDRLVTRLARRGYPFVVVGRVPEDQEVWWVNNDNAAAAREAVEHLLGLGHRRVGCLAGAPEYLVTQDRVTGYRQALEAHGLPFDPELVRFTDFSREQGSQAARGLLGLPDPPTAFFATDDLLAWGALQVASDLGLQVPRDLSVVGFNDDPMSGYLNPPLTTVRVPIFELGRVAARLLLERLHDPASPVQHVLVPTHLVPRASTAAAPRAATA